MTPIDIYSGYITKEKPDPDSHIIALFYFEAHDAVNAAQAIAAESSIGTWTELRTMKKRIKEKLAAKVFDFDSKKGLAQIAYPLELFEPGNVPQLLSDIAGNVFGMKEVENLRLLDVQFPRAYVKSFKGPALGLEGVRKLLGTDRTRRPHFGTIVKPKVGLNPKENAEVAYESWVGGVDFVKDDENLSNQRFCPFEERVIRTLEAKDKAESETGERKMYAPNITAETNEMLRRAEFVKEHGGNCIMIDIVTAGFAALQTVRDADFKLPIHAHRAMYAAFARNPKHGISMRVLAKLSRIIGVDQLHTGAIVGKMEGKKSEILEINDQLRMEWMGLKPVFPVASGGIDPIRMPVLLDIAGTDLVINAGGGIHGHPDGTRAGAMALRQAYEAWAQKIPIEEYAKKHTELSAALKKWGKRGMQISE